MEECGEEEDDQLSQSPVPTTCSQRLIHMSVHMYMYIYIPSVHPFIVCMYVLPTSPAVHWNVPHLPELLNRHRIPTESAYIHVEDKCPCEGVRGQRLRVRVQCPHVKVKSQSSTLTTSRRRTLGHQTSVVLRSDSS